MRSICTSRLPERRRSAGFTLVELLVGLALALCLAVTTAPLWLSLQAAGVRETDRAVGLLQSRVAIARFERDMRFAGAGGCGFPVLAPVLEATPSQVVFLERTGTTSPPILVEWEISKGSLMRRWGRCPAKKPFSFGHALFTDHKTMLEGVGGGSAFAYVIDGETMAGPAAEADLASIEAVILTLSGGAAGGGVLGTTAAWVGR